MNILNRAIFSFKLHNTKLNNENKNKIMQHL